MSRSSQLLRGCLTGWLVALAQGSLAPADDHLYLTIEGNGRALGETPIILETKEALAPGSHALTSDVSKTVRPATVFKDQGKTFLGTVLERVPGQGKFSLNLPEETLPESPGTGVELIPHGQRIEVRVDGKLVTEYVPDDGPKPYFYPLIGPSGAAMTRAFPMKKVEAEKYDHPHHRSFWFTHGNVNKVDFWTELPGHGRIVETSRPTVVGGLAMGTIRTTDDWIAPDGRKVCEDERVVRIYHTKQSRVLDFDVTLKASVGPVTFGDTKEGTFGLRVASSMDVTAKAGGRIVNAEGVEDVSAWGKSSPWVDYSGPVGGKTVGVAILNHPSSFRYPTTWHVRDYGLFAANPFGWHDFGRKTSGEHVLPQGESIRFRYRVILHEGDTASAAIPSAFQAYEAPPEAVIH